ncbi:hypothetical protein OIDMADRAFT_137431 [Oidiodendron maius Zn]|uniref:Zn(2)-C6 fungal-type domain-containing protein n=1 Tax=Oidiodendron maius (strain Zn) TaxID=913774 RepID=A0A0C3GTH8_OIDMZ|nr:hypothetical protein OIDMADRAFT_137431 [Oidiodendron maius Zn]
MASRAAATHACDACRRRKVKCDATDLCANCRISRLPCQYTYKPKKRGPKAPGLARNPRSAPEPEHVHIAPSPPSTEDTSFWPSPTSSSFEGGKDPVKTAGLARTIRHRLLETLQSSLPSMVMLDIVNYCIDLYMQYTFPSAPSVHEPTLRAGAARFFAEPIVPDLHLFGAGCWPEQVADMRSFALITALCASNASMMPESLISYRESLAIPFLGASRAMLQLFEDWDLEHPTSSSILTRVFHSSALQQTTGKTAVAFHVLGQATLLVLAMRLYREESLRAFDDIEAHILRSLFWQIYAADQASACLCSRPHLLHEASLGEKISLRPPSEGERLTPLLDPSRPGADEIFETRLRVGFHFLPHLWSSAARLLLDVRSSGRADAETGAALRTHLTKAYMNFLSIMDGLPPWLQAANLMATPDDGAAARFQKAAFWVQRCTTLVTFQCLRLVILQQCIESEAWDVVGLTDQSLTLSLTKLGVIHDFVQTLDDIPFIYVQVKGEPTVERIRRVGIVLLEMICNEEDETIKLRAKHYFTRLLHILTRLDSHASDEMNSWQQ